MRSIGMEETATGEVVVDAGTGDAASRPLSVVEDVEGFCSKFEARCFVDLEVFEKGHVKVGPPRHVQEITPGISKREAAGESERAGIEKQGTRSAELRGTGRRWGGVGVSHDVRKC